MKKKICGWMIFLGVLFGALGVLALSVGRSPFERTLIVISAIIYLLGLPAIVILTISSVITAVKRKGGKVRITFKEEGKIVKKYVKLVFSDDKKVIFKDEKNRYECSPEEIIKIQKRNKSFVVLLIVLGVVLLTGALDYLVYYATDYLYATRG